MLIFIIVDIWHLEMDTVILVLNIFETNDMIKNRKRKNPATFEFIDNELTSYKAKRFFKH